MSIVLKGYDPDWQPAIRKTRAYYRNLSPGEYTFQVRAIDRDLNYSEMAQIQLSVEPDPRIEGLTATLNNSGGVTSLSVRARFCNSFKTNS